MARCVAFDSGFLAAFFDGTLPVRPPPQGQTNNLGERLAALFTRLDEDQADIIVPAPALAELLVPATRDCKKILSWLDRQARARIGPFDQKAAVECSILLRGGLDRRSGEPGMRNCIKYDAMILSIALVEGASVIYTDDDQLRTIAEKRGLTAMGFWDLPFPAQGSLPGLA